MSYQELVYGMTCVQECVIKGEFPSRITARGYSAHMKFITSRGLSKAYDAEMLAKYEYKVTTKVIAGDLVDFVACDEDTRHNYLGHNYTVPVRRALAREEA